MVLASTFLTEREDDDATMHYVWLLLQCIPEGFRSRRTTSLATSTERPRSHRYTRSTVANGASGGCQDQRLTPPDIGASAMATGRDERIPSVAASSANAAPSIGEQPTPAATRIPE
jgi:hypothetical protein